MADVSVALTGAASTTGLNTLGVSKAIALTGASLSGRAGVMTSSVGAFQGLTLTIPPVVLAMSVLTGKTASLGLVAPVPTLAIQATTPVPAQLYLAVPAPSLAMSAITGQTATLALEVPTISLRLGGSDGLSRRIPPPDLAMAGVTGQTAVFAPRVAMPTLAMSAITNQIASLALRPPIPTLQLAAGQGITGRLQLTVPPASILLGAAAGSVATLQLAVPAPSLVFTGGFAAVGRLYLTVPVPAELMQGFTTVPVQSAQAIRATYVLQTERMALSAYTNFPFNSFATFQGKVLGATDSGIFELTGNDDAGTKIDAEIRTGVTDMNTSRIKRVDRVYIGYRALRNYQALILRVMTNETQQRDYGVPASINTMLHGSRTRLGLGVESRYWQFGLLNRDGLDFTIDSIEVAPIPYARRRGQKDA